MKLVAKLFAVLVLSCAAYFATIEQTTFAEGSCSGNSCQRCQCQRRNCQTNCHGNVPCNDRCDQAFLNCPGVDLECWNGRDKPERPPIQD